MKRLNIIILASALLTVLNCHAEVLGSVSSKDGTYTISLPQGWVQIQDPAFEIAAHNDSRQMFIFVNSVDKKDIADWSVYAQSRMDGVMRGLVDTSKPKFESVKIRGLDAKTVDVAGALKGGLRVRIHGIMLNSDKRLVWIFSGCPESRYESVRNELENLANLVDFK